MKQSQSPKNQYALVIWMLIEHKESGVTMMDAMKYFFHKYQTRQLEIEKSLSHSGKPRSFKLKIRRLPMTKKNRFGHTMTYTNYKALCSVAYLRNLLVYLNKNGLKK